MDALPVLYVAAMSLALLAAVGVGALAWRRRPGREPTALVVLTAAAAVWILGSLGSVLAHDLALSVLLAKGGYFGIVAVSPAFLVLALLYTGRGEWVDRRLLAALAVEPVVVLAAVWLPADLVWATVEPADALSGFETTYGPLFWAHVAYAYVLTLAATGFLFELLYRSRYLYGKQVVSLLVAALAPWVANVLYLSATVPFDPTPVAFAVTGVALSWGILEAGLVDISPIARDTVVDHLNRGVYVFDADDRLVDVNSAGRAQLALDDDPIGAAFEDLAADYPEFAETFRDACEKRETVVVDMPAGRRAFDVDVTELTDYRGRRQGRVFLVQDVTEQRRRQRRLQQQNEQLDRFASVVSHDLRNPLNVLEGYVELARDTGDPAHLDEAQASIDRMNDLIDDVLTLAREGREIETKEPVDLRSVAEDAWASVDVPAGRLTVTDDHTVAADRSRLQQALENLFRNAVEHVGPDVTVEVGALDDGPGFYVQDDGPGIPEEHRDSVFEHGYTTESEGTGLGLSIVDAIAQAHGWVLSLADCEAGTRFEFREVDVETADVAVGRRT